MMDRRSLAAAAALYLGVFTIVPAASGQSADQPRKFPSAKVRFEQNATDGDVEVVFEITGRSDGLTKLSVEAPDGRMVVDFASDESGKAASGFREFVFESPEPTDVAGLKAAFPEGAYKFEGETESGAQLRGTATLSHKLPATTSSITPKADARDVAVNDVKISWRPVSDIAAYMIELEQEETDTIITAKLPGSAPSFSVPNGFLRPGAEYKLGIGTVSKDGNVSFVETSFTTAAGK